MMSFGLAGILLNRRIIICDRIVSTEYASNLHGEPVEKSISFKLCARDPCVSLCTNMLNFVWSV